jgi:hypothetical protein
VILFLIIIIVIFALAKAFSGSSNSPTSPSNSPSGAGAEAAPPTSKPTPVPVRQVSGTAVVLGAGTFTAGKEVALGLYDVTTVPGQSGNFIVSGTDSYNEILGVAEDQGVPKVRVRLSDGDYIQISSLSKVIFTPVVAAFVTFYGAASLYAGTFTVGEDIAAGRYVAQAAAGQSGNFIVSGTDSYNEILGSSEAGGVPNVTVTLTNGDVVELSGLSRVNFTPTN